MGTRSWAYALDGPLYPLGDAAIPQPQQPLPPGKVSTTRRTTWNVLSSGGGTPGKLWMVGLSRSTLGLNAGDAQKRLDVLERVQQMASRVGMTAAALRAETMWHSYNGGVQWDATTDSSWTWPVNNGFKGLVMNQHCAGGGSNYAAWARGDLDANFRSYLASIRRVRSPGFKSVVVMEHEPENNTGFKDPTSAGLWAQGTARFMKITFEFADPDIIYSTCHIPGASGTDRNTWNPRPALNTLMGSASAAQQVMDRTLCGMDPYPEISNTGHVQTLADRCAAPIRDYKAWGFTRFYMPEVAFFNYTTGGQPGGLTAAQQAKRLHDEFWVWGKAQGFEGYTYFDVTDINNPRGDSRTLDTPEEQAEYARIILNNA